MADSAEFKRWEVVPANARRETDEIRELVSTPTVGCEVPAIAHEQVPIMEVAEASKLLVAESAEFKRWEVVPANARRETDEIRDLASTPTMGCEVPAIAHEQVPTMEVAEASSRDNNKRVEEARRARVAKLEKLRRECASEEEYDTARTQSIRTQLDVTAFKTVTSTELDSSSSSSCLQDGLSAEELERIREDNRRHFQHLVDTQFPSELRWFGELGEDSQPFFFDFGDRLEAGKKLGGGGQAEIHEAVFDGEVSSGCVLKVFGIECHLANLQHLWLDDISRLFWRGLDQGRFDICLVKHGTLLEDGRFVFVLERYAGDLRKCIDSQIVMDKIHNKPPFPSFLGRGILCSIACGMRALHEHGILHKDLKAANILLPRDPRAIASRLLGAVADFDSPKGVVGTGFWRAPEVLLALKNRNLHSSEQVWTEKVDVYSYAMTCYEVLTGCIPFEDRAIGDFDGILEGERPPLPDDVDPWLQHLVRRCWHSKPEMRPHFTEIVEEFNSFESRSFGFSRSEIEVPGMARRNAERVG